MLTLAVQYNGVFDISILQMSFSIYIFAVLLEENIDIIWLSLHTVFCMILYAYFLEIYLILT